MSTRKIISLAAAYVVIGFLSFGWVYNHTEPEIRCWYGDLDRCFETTQRPARSLFAGLFWPVHWAAVVALTVTK